MTKGTRIGIGIATLAAVIAIGIGYMMMSMSPPADLDLAREKPTAKGLYIVAIAPENEPFERNALHAWTATVKTADGTPVEEAEIAIDGGMPQHGHGLPTAPAVTASLGDGRYRIEGVRFNMSGWWEFKLKVKAAAGEDDVTFNLSL
jgi:hypothetical protein